MSSAAPLCSHVCVAAGGRRRRAWLSANETPPLPPSSIQTRIPQEKDGRGDHFGGRGRVGCGAASIPWEEERDRVGCGAASLAPEQGREGGGGSRLACGGVVKVHTPKRSPAALRMELQQASQQHNQQQQSQQQSQEQSQKHSQKHSSPHSSRHREESAHTASHPDGALGVDKKPPAADAAGAADAATAAGAAGACASLPHKRIASPDTSAKSPRARRSDFPEISAASPRFRRSDLPNASTGSPWGKKLSEASALPPRDRRSDLPDASAGSPWWKKPNDASALPSRYRRSDLPDVSDRFPQDPLGIPEDEEVHVKELHRRVAFSTKARPPTFQARGLGERPYSRSVEFVERLSPRRVALPPPTHAPPMHSC